MLRWVEKRGILNWLAVLVIAGVIFYVSSLTFPPGKPVFNIFPIIYHFLAFFWLAFFLSLALVRGKRTDFMVIAILIAVMYAVSDEFHQLFVPGRACDFKDFLVDSGGIILASLIYMIRLKKK